MMLAFDMPQRHLVAGRLQCARTGVDHDEHPFVVEQAKLWATHARHRPGRWRPRAAYALAFSREPRREQATASAFLNAQAKAQRSPAWRKPGRFRHALLNVAVRVFELMGNRFRQSAYLDHMAAIEAEELTRIFQVGEEVRALDGLTVSLERGSLVPWSALVVL